MLEQEWSTPALTGYSFEDFSPRTTRSCLLLRPKQTNVVLFPEIDQVKIFTHPHSRVVSKKKRNTKTHRHTNKKQKKLKKKREKQKKPKKKRRNKMLLL